jgi:type I restriction enzyme S subunit
VRGTWPEVQIADVAELIRGVTYAKDDARSVQESGYLPVLRATNIQESRLVLDSDLVFVPKGNVSANQTLRAGDIVLATSSGSKHLVGKSALLRHEWSGSFGAFCAAIRPSSTIDSRYLASFLQSPAYWKQIGEKSMGVNINNLRRGDIESVTLPLPDLEEQRRIVAELEKQFSRLDDAVANLQRVKANLKRYKAAILKAAVEGRLVETEATLARCEGRTYETGEQLLQRVLLARPDQWSARGRYVEPLPAETKNLLQLPEGWAWASIDQLSDFITKGTTPAATKMFDGSGDVQFLKVYNLTFGGSLNYTHKPAYVSRATHTEELARSQVFPGDVLINIVGPPLGQVSVVPAHIPEANINQAIARIRPIKPIGSEFIAIALMCDDIMRWAIRRGKTTAGQANLTLELCRALPVPVPPLAEQARIVAEVDRHLSVIREVEAEVDANLQRSQSLRQATLVKAFVRGDS